MSSSNQPNPLDPSQLPEGISWADVEAKARLQRVRANHDWYRAAARRAKTEFHLEDPGLEPSN